MALYLSGIFVTMTLVKIGGRTSPFHPFRNRASGLKLSISTNFGHSLHAIWPRKKMVVRRELRRTSGLKM
jgi:hypothetical protein